MWYKAISTQHGRQNNEIRKLFPQELIEAGKTQSITGIFLLFCCFLLFIFQCNILGELIKQSLSLEYPLPCLHRSINQIATASPTRKRFYVQNFQDSSDSPKPYLSIKEFHPVIRELISSHLPWILKKYPRRYPFLYNQHCYKTYIAKYQ